MNKKIKIVLCIIILIAIISLLTVFIINKVKEEGREYEIPEIKEYNYFVMQENDKYGVIDKNGKIIVEPDYETVVIPNPEIQVFVCYSDNKGQLQINGEFISNYDNIEAIRLKNIASDLMYEKTVVKYQKEGKYGLLNLDGKQVTKPIYEEIDSLPYKEGELIVKQNDKYGIINIKGNNLVPIEYEEIAVDGYYKEEDSYKNAGYIVNVKTQDGYRYGYIAQNGDTILETEYNDITRIVEKEDDKNVYLIASKNGQCGIFKNKNQIVNNEYQSIRYDETNDVMIVEKSKKYGVVNMEGKTIIPVEYEQIDSTGMYLYAQKEEGTTVFNKEGNEVKTDVNTAKLNTDNENYIILISNENNQTLYGLLDKEGKEIIKPTYNYLEYLFDDFFIASSENGKLGVVNSKGEEVVPIDNDSVQKVQDTTIVQTTKSKENITTLYTNKLQKICELKNATLEKYKEFIKLYNNEETHYITKEGVEEKNTQIFSENSLFASKIDEKWGFTDKEGNIKVQPIYEKVTEFNEYGFAGIKQNGKWGVINENGDIIVEPIYTFADNVQPFFIDKYFKITYGFGEFYYTATINEINE